ncbi:hypothetical protein [Streptomyces filamentosus]|uniref:hypothetical protein n=1 Tax=Streptomyces filamentosus TaxID=67294 RepID=UPI003318A0C4
MVLLGRARSAPPSTSARGGIVRDGGAATQFVCEPSKSPSDRGKYIALYVDTLWKADPEKTRSAVPGLLKEFMTFARRELDRPGGASGGQRCEL